MSDQADEFIKNLRYCDKHSVHPEEDSYGHNSVMVLVKRIEEQAERIKELQAKYDDLFTVAHGYQERLRDSVAELGRIRRPLLTLVALKKFKDQHGKTAKYLDQQPRAWEDARRALGMEEQQNDH